MGHKVKKNVWPSSINFVDFVKKKNKISGCKSPEIRFGILSVTVASEEIESLSSIIAFSSSSAKLELLPLWSSGRLKDILFLDFSSLILSSEYDFNGIKSIFCSNL